MALPAHQHQPEDDTDEELSDEQVRELLNQAERRMRAKQAASPIDARSKLPTLNPGFVANSYMKGGRLDDSKLISEEDRLLARGIKKIEDPVQIKKAKAEEKKATAGSDWFNLPATELTPELRRDLQLLKMRGVLDPKRHYKKDNKSEYPAFSQVGTVIEGPTEFLKGRLTNKERKKTLMEEVLAQEQQSGRFKRKVTEIHATKMSGKKGFYKALQAKRKSRVAKK
ncbi:Fcf2-domain-containing protein [Pleomassaria siparia CBS 279.74]|uniref:Fcf2-domain-containing protein n=1 Tax=Pleomassaria siparia CBS 279.74 TaxID=1314801 RepID=A0A6G1KQV4_9PLEO|nr:Fcf2-domain-containing protein [Pleomassaria siparia CBS 279.74]